MSQELEGTLTNSADLVGSFGSTGSGSNNYNDLVNKPSINNVELSGNKTGNQLGLVSDTDLATVATTGNYNDLLHKPTIPAAQVNSDWNAISGVARILNKPTIPTKTSDLTNDSGYITSSGLATVATTGDYVDLTNKPTLSTVATTGDYVDLTNKPTLSTVATTGSYIDLTDKPTLSGTAIINDPTSDPDETIAQKISAVEGSLSTVATTGNYNDLTNKPKIQSGYEVGTKDSDGVRTIVFPEPFNTVSAVTVTPVYTTMPSAGEYIRACTVLALSTTQFRYVEVARKNDGTYYTPAQTTDKCFYIAVGT